MHQKSALGPSWLVLALSLIIGTFPLGAQTVRQSSVSNDFNADGNGDILWQNSSDGELQIWLMRSFSTTGRRTVRLTSALSSTGSKIGGTLADLDDRVLFKPPLRIVSTRDFDGDGSTDLLSYSDSTGEVRVDRMFGDRYAGWQPIIGEDGRATFVGLPWRIVGTFASNRRLISNCIVNCGPPPAWPVDIFWHNSSTGEIQIWHTNRGTVTGRATVLGEDGATASVGEPWGIAGIEDMNGDEKGDIVWYNGSTGETQIWYMDGKKVQSRSTVVGENGSAALIGAPWSIVGTNDFNRDGKSDLLWYNTSTGETQIWHMNGHRFIGRATVLGEDGKAALVGPPWSIVKH